MKKIFIFIFILCLLPFVVLADKTNSNSEQVIAYFDTLGNLSSGESTEAYYYRRILQNYLDGNYLIQDFYVLSDRADPRDKLKLTDPYKVKLATLKDFDAEPFDGPKIMWTQNGIKFNETNYLNGEKHGLSFAWYPTNGKKWIKLNYVNGKKEGPYISWYLNGQKEREGKFLNGRPDGLWLSWNETGEQTKSEFFEDGKIVE